MQEIALLSAVNQGKATEKSRNIPNVGELARNQGVMRQPGQ